MGPIIAHTPDDFRAALAAAREIGVALLVLTAPGAVSYAGSLYLLKLVEDARKQVGPSPARVVLDCGDATGYALGALRAGWREIMVDGAEAVRDKIADIAAQGAARLIERPQAPALDLAGVADPVRACLDHAAALSKGRGHRFEKGEGAGSAPNEDDDR